MTLQDHKDLVRRFIEHGVAQRDLDAIAETCEPGSMFAKGVVGQIASMHAPFPDLAVAIDDLVAEGDKVVARVTVTGTNTGPIVGLPGFGKLATPAPPTGRPVSNSAIYIFTVHDGRIRSYFTEVDQVGMLLQLGWTFTPPGADPIGP